MRGKNGFEDEKLTAQIHMYVAPQLKKAAGQRADEEGLPLSEWIAKVVAEKLGDPGLGVIPRKPRSGGRPRTAEKKPQRRPVIGRPRKPIEA